MNQNHPHDDRPRNGTPMEDEYYPEGQAPRQHFPHGYSQQGLGGPATGFHASGYPGQEPFAYPLQTPSAKKWKVWPWVVGGILLVALIACGLSTLVLGAGAKAISDEVSATKADVTLVQGSCQETEFGGWEAKVKIVNSGTSARSYWVQVNLMNGSTRLGEAHAIVNDLGPGQSVTEKATGQGDLVKGATCVIGDVN